MTEFTLQELAKLVEAELVGEASLVIRGVEELLNAGEEDASFCANPRYFPLLEKTKAGVVCVLAEAPRIKNKNYLISKDPSATFQKLITLFLKNQQIPSGFSGLHPTAVIHPSVKLGAHVTVGPCSVIDAECVIGEGTVISAHVSIGPRVKIGANCLLHPQVTIESGSILHNRVILQSGSVIGSCGFGYTTTAHGHHIKQDQLGIVVLEDDVEIGANTTIDRARFKTTTIARGTKIDNLVQIGHNSQIGPYNLIVSQTGIAGSVKTGRNVVMGGQTGTVGHVTIADGALFAARSGIKKSILKPGKYGGNPAISLDESNRESVHVRKIKDYAKKIKELEDGIKTLEK